LNYIQVEDRNFYYDGKPIRLRGFGIGTWLNLEHFMIGIPTSDQMIQSAFQQEYGSEVKDNFFRKYREEFFKEEDFKLLKECGVNFIRVPFNYRLFIEDNHTESYLEEGFTYFNHLFSLCKKYEIFALIDLHTTPGSQNPDWHSDNSNGVPLFWKYQIFRRQITKLWGAIASRYKEEPFLMGYDLINEPAMANWSMLNEFYEETIKAIREVDKNHVIVLEGDQFSMDFSGLKQFDDKQLALSFHYYPTVWHPDLLDKSMDRQIRKSKIADGLDFLFNIREDFDCPAFCGEYGYGADCGDFDFTMELLIDTMDLMEEREIDWLLWCYKDAHFMSMVSPKQTTDWMKLAHEINHEWTQDIEKEQAARILELIGQNWFSEITESEKYLLQFRLRACLYVLQQKHILLPKLKQITADEILKMPLDFSYENCEIYTELRDLMKKVLL
jgi:Endoglucanase